MKKRIAILTSVAALTGGAIAGCGGGSEAATTDSATQQQSTQPTGAGSSADMAAQLAQELGVSEEKVRAALEKLAPQGGPPAGGQAPPTGGQTPPSGDGQTTPDSTTS